MNKLRNWRRKRHNTRSRSKKEREAILPSAMAAQPTQGQSETPETPETPDLSIFLNDFTDSDNDAAAVTWAAFLDVNPNFHGVYIAEPRHVNLGYYMKSEEFGRCISLVSRLEPPLASGEPPLTTILTGRMTEEIIKSRTVDNRELDEEECDLLRRCIKPKNGSREDAVNHARLVAMDCYGTMKARCSRHFDAYIDVACLDKLESPINLKTHYHDELVARTAEELREFRTITYLPTSDEEKIEHRRAELRKWYDKALGRKKGEFGNECPLQDLSYDHLLERIRSHKRVIFFGGASLTVLQEILEREPALGQKIHYYQQGGTFDSKLNILGNPYNFALNTKAAEYVFDNHDKLGKFTLVPTDTTKKLEFTIQGLAELSAPVGVRSLAFHGRLDPWVLVSSKEQEAAANEQDSNNTLKFMTWRAERWVNDPIYSGTDKTKKAVMADLVAFLISFTDAFKEFKTDEGITRQSSIKVTMSRPIRNSNQMVLQEDQTSKIECLLLDIPKPKGDNGQQPVLVKDTLRLVRDGLSKPFSPS